MRARRSGGLHVRHAPRRSDAVHDRAADAARRRWPPSCRSARRRCTTRSRATAERVGDARRSPPRGRGASPTAPTTPAGCTPAEVSGIASAIDVPVYIFGIVPSIDNPSADDRDDVGGALGARRPAGAISRRWTGGHVFVASTPAQRSIAARQIVDELRHQYLIAFESSGTPGWHPLVVRARDKDLTVRARSGYIAGQSRPIRIRRIDHVSEILHGPPDRGAGGRWVDGVRDQEVRAHQRRRSERQGRLARPLGRGDAGAHAQERRAITEVDQKAQAGGRRRRRRRRQRATAAQQRAQPTPATATEAGTKVDAIDKASQAPRLRSRAQRGSGQLQVRQDRAAGRSQGARSTRWSRS